MGGRKAVPGRRRDRQAFCLHSTGTSPASKHDYSGKNRSTRAGLPACPGVWRKEKEEELTGASLSTKMPGNSFSLQTDRRQEEEGLLTGPVSSGWTDGGIKTGPTIPYLPISIVSFCLPGSFPSRLFALGAKRKRRKALRGSIHLADPTWLEEGRRPSYAACSVW